MNSDFILAVHALVFLNHKAAVLNSDVLAENICTNPARVRRVMTQLRKAKLVEVRGWREESGYFFPHEPDQITLRMVGEALRVCYVSTGWRSGDCHMQCRIASGISTVIDEIFADLDRACQERLQQITIRDVDRQLFEGSEIPLLSKEKNL